jgi:hypothetical protein
MAVATKRKNTLPTPAHVQALIDALEAIRPAHWTASHGLGRASGQWTIYSEVFRARVDDCKFDGELTRGGYRVGILIEEVDNKFWISFFLFDSQAAAKRFKANFRPEMVQPLIALEHEGRLHCAGTTMRSGDTPRNTVVKSARSAYWIWRWMIDPRFYNERQLQSFQLEVGIFSFDTAQRITQEANRLAAAYLPLLECMFPLDGEPISEKRLTRIDPLRRNLAKVTGPAKQCSCEHRRIVGLDSTLTCGGRLEAAHIRPYQQGGSGEASNGLWLCHVHHCETEGRIEGNRLSVRLLDHIPQLRRSSLVG